MRYKYGIRQKSSTIEANYNGNQGKVSQERYRKNVVFAGIAECFTHQTQTTANSDESCISRSGTPECSGDDNYFF